VRHREAVIRFPEDWRMPWRFRRQRLTDRIESRDNRRDRRQHRAARAAGAPVIRTRRPAAVQRARYMTLETIAPLSDNSIVSLPAVAD
jgi:hypothetical protein